ncbi:MAG TPA: nucleotidyltransferase family protein [Bryobacteraceae bacterium]|nr:nucleotidyltransferase family protein [Bryobacteraceae bacterium]
MTAEHISDATAEVTWENLIPLEHWQTYKCVLEKLQREEIPFALGGGLALGVFTQKFRRSKDIDIYVEPQHRDRIIAMMTECGLEDLYSKKEYVRDWIYRGHRDDVIVDAIWAMANRRAVVDRRWVEDGPTVQLFGGDYKVIPPEELMWSKLYVLQHDRCDWPDIMNLINATGPSLDWEHLIRRVAEDRPLVKGVLSVFSWLCPDRAATIPRRIWDSLGLAVPGYSEPDPEGRPSRKDLLDTRPWFFLDCAA